MKDVQPLVIEFRVEGEVSRLVIDGEGLPAPVMGCVDGEPDLVIVRSRAVHAADLTGALPAEEIAAGTAILTDSGHVVTCWGLPVSVSLCRSLDAQVCLRLNLSNTPFAYRPVGIDLRLRDGHFSTGIAEGTADIEVGADWTSAVAWLTQPRVLFADAFPGAVRIGGEIALLSLCEGALWHATSNGPAAPVHALLRWSQLWPSASVRRALHAGEQLVR